MRTVAILCAAKKTAYRDIPGLEIYDEARDARTFQGGMPVVAHPPCRYWLPHGFGTIARAAVTPEKIKAEKELGFLCVKHVLECGGILEQPARSLLWKEGGLPVPGLAQSPDSFALHVWQAWWGMPVKKGTWLYFRGINQFAIDIPFCLHAKGADKKWYRNPFGGHAERTRQSSHTVPAFAQWLVALARTARIYEAAEKARETKCET